MANDANLSLERKPKSPKKVVINVNIPPVGGWAEHFNPGGCPPPPPKECDCKVVVKHHKRGHNLSKFNKHAHQRSTTAEVSTDPMAHLLVHP